ncbi:nucleotide pyrophosphatase [Chitinophaga parva]|uniref:Nucleotide pyrophosphatase n=1 Tax=Chitinophaga parva TaxID=2169414 RepID=A0A2T7BGB5_9BACT|nr:alkaline phosphatase family protein [Chitinophaga parva]PUZ25321.1 nucleotide pyrophosphatase [Chitinophaga parva]
MKKYCILFFCLAGLSLTTHAQRARKVVFVITDGVPADFLESVQTPNLDKISKAGHYMRAYVGGEKGAYSETPTISAVGYNSLLTGTWANKHNVWDNYNQSPDYHYPTIFRLLKDQYPAKKIAVYSTWTDNRTLLVGDGLAQTGGIHVDEHADGYELDTVRFPHDEEGRTFMHRIDEQVTADAVKGILQKAPDLSWIYLEYTDDMGHKYGDSPQLTAAVRMFDEQMGKVWEAIQYREKHYPEDWMIIMTTDHGRTESNGKGHGGQSPRQRTTWILTSNPAINAYPNYFMPGVVDIYPTIARFMGISIPVAVNRELDGIPFIGKVSLIHMDANYIQGKIDVNWVPLSPNENTKVKIWVSTTNNVKTGGEDQYKLMGEWPLKQKHASIDVKDLPSRFYKVVLEGADNSINRWIVLDQKAAG